MEIDKSFKKFLILWIASLISRLGNGITYFSITIWFSQIIYSEFTDRDSLTWALSAYTLAFTLSTVLSQPIVGVLSDRFSRKKLMVVSNYFNGIITFIIALLIILQSMAMWILILLTILSSILRALHSSAFAVSYIMIVPEKHLPRANALTQTGNSLTNIISPIVALWIFSFIGFFPENLFPFDLNLDVFEIGFAISVDGISFILIAFIISLINIPSPQKTITYNEKKDKKITSKLKLFIKDISIGFKYLNKPFIWLLSLAALGNFVFSLISVLEPIIVKYILNDWQDTRDYDSALALLITSSAAGGVFGGIAISIFGGFKEKKFLGVILPLIVASGAQIFYGLSNSLYITAFLSFVLFSMIPIMQTHSTYIWQTDTPKEIQGRVFAIRRLIAQITVPLSAIFAGYIGNKSNLGIWLSILGFCFMIYCIIQLFNPHLKKFSDNK